MQIADELGIPASLLRDWRNDYQGACGGVVAPRHASDAPAGW
jgi:transposase-like protein